MTGNINSFTNDNEVVPSAPKSHQIFLSPWPNYLSKFNEVCQVFSKKSRWLTDRLVGQKNKTLLAEVIVSKRLYSGWGSRGAASLSLGQNVTMWRNTPDNMPPPFLSPDLLTKCCSLTASQPDNQSAKTITSLRHTLLCKSKPLVLCQRPHVLLFGQILFQNKVWQGWNTKKRL